MSNYSAKRIASVMQKELLHSEHAAICWLDAQKKERADKREKDRKHRAKLVKKAKFAISNMGG